MNNIKNLKKIAANAIAAATVFTVIVSTPGIFGNANADRFAANASENASVSELNADNLSKPSVYATSASEEVHSDTARPAGYAESEKIAESDSAQSGSAQPDSAQSDSVQSEGETPSSSPKQSEPVDMSDYPYWPVQWDMKIITDNGEAFKYCTNMKDVNVAVVDSGVNLDTAELNPNQIRIRKNFVSAGGFDGTDADETGEPDRITDTTGHGTQVVSQLIAGKNLHGIALFSNVNVYRVSAGGHARTQWIIDAIKAAADDGNDVINLSLGEYLMISGEFEDGSNDYQEYVEYKEAIDYAISKGAVIVAAAGNESLNIDDNDELLAHLDASRKAKNPESKIKTPGKVIDMPSMLPEVISVGGFDGDGERSDFSNYSSRSDNFIYAPAGTMKNYKRMAWQEFIDGGYLQRDFIVVPVNSQYGFNAGNSLAAPKISGAVAAVISKYGLYDRPEYVRNYINSAKKNVGGLNVIFMSDVIRADAPVICNPFIHVIVGAVCDRRIAADRRIVSDKEIASDRKIAEIRNFDLQS